nr:hypothetical protein [Bacteroidaceae bacterium]
YRSKTGGYTNNPEEAYEGIQQDGEGNYLLGCLCDWQVFAEIVNSGTNPAANAKMTADIDLGDDQTILGTTTDLAYKGTFDGQGHTLTVNISSSVESFAPFRYVGDGAAIQNLRIAGTVNGSNRRVGGFVGEGYGTYSISNCISSVTLNTTYNGDGIQGGFVASQRGTCQVTDCIFDGVFYGPNAYTWGGIVGWNYGSTSISNCLVLCDSYNVSNTDVATFIPNSNNITNCYYKTAIGTAQGTQATTAELADGTISTALQNGRAEEVWVQDPVTNQPMLAVFAGKYTVPASGLGTFSAKAAFTLPEGLDAYYCKDYDTSEGTIGVVAINGVVPAETGVLLRGEPGETYTLTTSNETPAMVTDNALVAVTEQMNIAQTADDYTNFGLSGGVFKKVNTNGGIVKANHAYLHIPTSALTTDASARGIYLSWDDDATGITAVNGSGLTVNSCYDLQGRRTENPSKGLYIVNGKKVIIK